MARRIVTGLWLSWLALGCADGPGSAARSAPDASDPGSVGDASVPDAATPTVRELRWSAALEPDHAAGAARLGPGQGLSADLQVPAGAVGMVVTARAARSGVVAELRSLHGPDGERLFPATDRQRGAYQPLRTRPLNWTLPFTLGLPTEPALPLRAGTYNLELAVGIETEQGAAAPLEPVDRDLDVSVDVVFRVPADTGAAPRLALALWFVRGSGLDADTAPAEPRLTAALDGVGAILHAAGIALDEPSYGDLAMSEGLSEPGDRQAMAELFELLVGDRGRTVHLIFVDQLGPPEGDRLLGTSSGLPGAPSHPALERRGGALVSLALLPDTALMSHVIAHELGHLLGLGHTSELDGQAHDPIADTPECPAELAAPAMPGETPQLDAGDCLLFGGDNLMFATTRGAPAPQTLLSAEQAAILRLSPHLLP